MFMGMENILPIMGGSFTNHTRIDSSQTYNNTIPKNQSRGKKKKQAHSQSWFMHQSVIKNRCKEINSN